MRIRQFVLGAALAAMASLAGAQGITFYEHENFGGRRFASDNAVANFEQYGFNDRATSVYVAYGVWQLCTDAYFRGRCVQLNPGEYRSLGAMGISNRVSSARQVGNSAEPGPGPGVATPVQLFDRYDFGGASFPVNAAIDNLDFTRWNDRALSMIVNSGTWEVCNDAHFQGGCERFGPGRYPNLGSLSGRASSLRQIGGGGGGGGAVSGGGGGWYPDGWGSRSRVVIYEGTNLTGRRYVIDADYVPNFDGTGFNDRASSLRIERGYWLFCSDANFQGDCRTFGPGDYPSLPAGLNDRISSGRRISNDYPYGQNPSWGARQ